MRVVLLTLLTAVLAPTSASADSELWTSGGVAVEASEKLRFGLSQSLRFDNGISQLKSAFVQADASFAAHTFVRVGGGFRYYMDKGGDPAQRMFLNLRLSYKKKKVPWRVGFRSQLQTTTRVNDTNVDYWRNRASGKYAVNKKVAPFLAFELFYSLDNSELRRYRTVAGVEVEVGKQWTVEASYIFQSEINQNNPERDHVLSLELSYEFDLK